MIIVASVSCIYGLGSPEAYYGMLVIRSSAGQELRATRCCGDSWTFSTSAAKICAVARFACAATRSRSFPPYEEDRAFRIEMWGDQIETIAQIDPLAGEVYGDPLPRLPHLSQSHYVLPAAAERARHPTRFSRN